MTATTLTQEYLHSILDYQKDTGLFIWKVSRAPMLPGKIASQSLNSSGYCQISIDRTSYRAHRLAWFYVYGEWPIGQIDHINGMRNDNRIANLRLADSFSNSRNVKLHTTNKSGICGVNWHNRDMSWRSYIGGPKLRESLGYYRNFFDACCARKSAENRIGYHPNHGRKVAAPTAQESK